MRPVWYIACEKFGPHTHKGWDKYLTWAKLPHLIEVVSLDVVLCPSVIEHLTAEDWGHNVAEDFKTDLFADLDYLVQRVGDLTSVNILATIEEPGIEDLTSFQDDRFVFKGFDLVERPGLGISALVNCGGFDKAFLPDELNQSGLISDYGFAREVQERLVKYYPEHEHAHCLVWAIWRMEV